MIKFFRNIRRRMLRENRFKRYLIYAIREIILVVIGILIALQVSNWNENRKTDIKNEILLDKFEDDLQWININANHDIRNARRKDSIYNEYFDNTLEKKDYWMAPSLADLSTWRYTLDPTLYNLNKVLDRQDHMPEKYDRIFKKINAMELIISREIYERNELIKSSNENLEFLNKNFEWMRMKDSTTMQKATNYFLNDSNFKKRVYNHYNKSLNYIKVLVRYRIEALSLFLNLKMVRENLYKNELDQVLQEMDLKPYKTINCSGELYTTSNNMTDRASMIINHTKEPKNIRINYDESNKKDNEIMPGEIYQFFLGDSRIHFQRYFSQIRVIDNDTCMKAYKEVENDYVILSNDD